MNRDFLKKLGLEADAIDKIMDENGKDIEKAKGSSEEQAGRIKELEKEVESLKGNIADRDKQLEELKKSSEGNDDLKKKIDELTEANKQAAEKHTAEMEALKKSHAIEKALSEASAKDVGIVRKLIDETKVSVDNGNLIGLEDQIKALKESETTKSLFSSGNPKIKGAEPGHGSDKDDPGQEPSEIQKRIAKYKKN